MGEDSGGHDSFDRSARSALVGASIAAVMLGACGVIISRLLGPAGKGQASVGLVIAAAVGTLLMWGVDVWIAGALRRYGWTSDVRRIVVQHLALAFAIGLVAVALALLAGVETALVLGVAVLAAGYVVALLGFGVASGAGRSTAITQAHLVTGVVSLGLVILLWALDRANVGSAISALGAGRLAGGLVGVRARPRLSYRPSSPARAGWAPIGFGLRTALGSTVALAIYRSDTVLVAALDSTRSAGIYSVAATLTELLWIVPDALASLVVSHAAAGAAPSQTARIIRVSLGIVVGGGAVLALLAPLVVPRLFGEEFGSGTGLVPPLAVAAGLLTVWKLLVADLAGRGDGAVRLRSIAWGLVVMVAVAAALVPPIGAAGAAAASIAGYGTAALIATRVWTHHGGNAVDLVRLSMADVRLVLGQLSSRLTTVPPPSEQVLP